MKKFLFTLTLACALALGSQPASAETKKSKKDASAPAEKDAAAPAAEKPAAPAAEKPKAADTAKPKADKPIPMYVHADEIDVAGKTITQVTKEGKKSKNTLTATTEIMNGDKPAKLEDIKVGDYVSGLRKKTGEGAFEVVKITKFGPKAAKTEGETKKPAGDAKKPEAEPKKK